MGNVQPGGTTTRATAKVRAPSATVTYGRTVPVTGTLTAGGTAAAAGLPVQIQAFVGTRWKTVATTTTRAGGVYGSTVKPSRTRNLRARFPGSGDLRATNSKVVPVGVRPILRVTGRPKRARTGSRAVIRGKVRPRRGVVWQVLKQRRGRSWRIVGRRKVATTKSGAFTSFFVPAASGSYRFYVVALKDRTYARGVTPEYPVTVTRGARSGGAGS